MYQTSDSNKDAGCLLSDIINCAFRFARHPLILYHFNGCVDRPHHHWVTLICQCSSRIRTIRNNITITNHVQFKSNCQLSIQCPSRLHQTSPSKLHGTERIIHSTAVECLSLKIVNFRLIWLMVNRLREFAVSKVTSYAKECMPCVSSKILRLWLSNNIERYSATVTAERFSQASNSLVRCKSRPQRKKRNCILTFVAI